jgi:hypothetical protein
MVMGVTDVPVRGPVRATLDAPIFIDPTPGTAGWTLEAFAGVGRDAALEGS